MSRFANVLVSSSLKYFLVSNSMIDNVNIFLVIEIINKSSLFKEQSCSDMFAVAVSFALAKGTQNLKLKSMEEFSILKRQSMKKSTAFSVTIICY